jgi:hypothetical protein
MPLAIPVGYCLGVITHSQPFGNQTQLITIGFGAPSAVTDPNEIAELLYTAYTGATSLWQPSKVADSSRLVGTKIYWQDEPDLKLGEYLLSSDGTRSAQPPSPQVCAIVKKRTAGVGRRYRGRFYLPASFLSASTVGPSGIIDTTPLNDLNARAEVFRGNMVTQDMAPVLLHTESPFTPTPITSMPVENMIGTQRRRLR